MIARFLQACIACLGLSQEAGVLPHSFWGPSMHTFQIVPKLGARLTGLSPVFGFRGWQFFFSVNESNKIHKTVSFLHLPMPWPQPETCSLSMSMATCAVSLSPNFRVGPVRGRRGNVRQLQRGGRRRGWFRSGLRVTESHPPPNAEPLMSSPLVQSVPCVVPSERALESRKAPGADFAEGGWVGGAENRR